MRFLGCILFVVLFLAWSHSAQAATPLAACTDGVATVGSGDTAVSYPCLRVDLMSHLSIPELGGTADATEGKNNAVSDIWGWVSDPNGDPDDFSDDDGDERQFAIVGLYCSTAFVEITDPANPVLIGTLPDHTELAGGTCYEAPVAPTPKPHGAQKMHEEEGAVWRDIKVINDYAYIVSDHAGAGLQVFDLSRLLTATAPEDFTENGWEGGFSKAHNLFTYEGTTGTPYAVVVGSNDSNNPGVDACTGTNGGGPIFYDLSNPLDPIFAGAYCDDGYTHDIQCVVYSGPDTGHTGDEICLASNEDTLTIFDATNKTAFQQLARKGYNNSAYTHQGWLDAEQKYFYLNDELDERTYGFPTRTMVWDVSDLSNPALVEEYLAPLFTIDHNNYVIDDYLYQSNYTSGLRILDISDRDDPYQKAFFDTYPVNNATVFDGSWSNYAWYPDGIVAVSDISGGLFVLRTTYQNATGNADMVVTVSTPETEYFYQDPFTYTVQIGNTGAASADAVYVTLLLSPGGVFDGQSEGTSECQVVAADLMECRLDSSIAPGDSRSLTVQAVGFTDGQVSALAIVSADQAETTPADNRTTYQVALKQKQRDGGGGAAGWLLLPGLLSFAWLRRRSV